MPRPAPRVAPATRATRPVSGVFGDLFVVMIGRSAVIIGEGPMWFRFTRAMTGHVKSGYKTGCYLTLEFTAAGRTGVEGPVTT